LDEGARRKIQKGPYGRSLRSVGSPFLHQGIRPDRAAGKGQDEGSWNSFLVKARKKTRSKEKRALFQTGEGIKNGKREMAIARSLPFGEGKRLPI